MCSDCGKCESRNSFMRGDSDIGHPQKSGQNRQEWSGRKAPALRSCRDSAESFISSLADFCPVVQVPCPGASQIHPVCLSPPAAGLEVWGSHSRTFPFLLRGKIMGEERVPFNAVSIQDEKLSWLQNYLKIQVGFTKHPLLVWLGLCWLKGQVTLPWKRWIIKLSKKWMEKEGYIFLKAQVLSFLQFLCFSNFFFKRQKCASERKRPDSCSKTIPTLL